jgi:hypothetical protein
VTGHYELVIDQDKRMGQEPLAGNVQHLAELLLYCGQRGIIIRHANLIPIDAREKGLGLTCGLLRRPSRPSTPHAYFVPAMPEDDDLDLLFGGQCLSVSLFHTVSYLFP